MRFRAPPRKIAPGTAAGRRPEIAASGPTCRQLAGYLLRPGVSSIFTIDRPYKTVLVGNPKVVDTRPLGERSVVLVPPPDAAGETNVIFVDEANAQITSVNVRVEPPPPPPPALRVLVHNKKLVSSYTGFRCEPTGCEYVEGRTVQEPALISPATTTTVSVNGNLSLKLFSSRLRRLALVTPSDFWVRD